MRRSLALLVTLIFVTASLSGCGHTMRKPVGKGTWIPLAICAAAGAGAGYGIQEARRGESISTRTHANGSQTVTREKDDGDHWIGALAGAGIGALVCGLAGHLFLDPEPAEQVPPTAYPEPTGKRIVLRGINFDFDKSTIRPDSEPILDAAVTILNDYPDVRILVAGYTDAIGTEEYNEKLSVRRAQSVFRYISNRGIAPERMDVIGYGKTRPVASNATESGRAQNRRVELHIVSQPLTGEPGENVVVEESLVEDAVDENVDAELENAAQLEPISPRDLLEEDIRAAEAAAKAAKSTAAAAMNGVDQQVDDTINVADREVDDAINAVEAEKNAIIDEAINP